MLETLNHGLKSLSRTFFVFILKINYLDFLRTYFYHASMENLKQLIKQLGGKKATAEKLMITIRYIDMILAGTKKPSKRLEKLIQIYLT